MLMRWLVSLIVITLLFPSIEAIAAESAPTLRAGAYAQDITPTAFPVVVNGGFLANKADRAHDPLHARALVLDDGAVRLAIVVVDSCMVPRPLLDQAKEMAAKATGIPAERMLISATHTHSAPSAMNACLGTDADPDYIKVLPGLIARAIEEAVKRLQPAQVGWAVVQDAEHTHNRNWIRRPDRIADDPFGERTVRAMMHPGHMNPDYIGPSGPVDTGLTILSIQSPDGRPLAVLANYSMHYFGAAPLSADWCGVFARRIGELVGAGDGFVGIMSQGTSGDLMWLDYGKPANKPTIEQFTEGVAQNALKAYQTIQYSRDLNLAMAERKLTLGRRLPDAQRLAWARKVAQEGIKDGVRKTQQEVYAHQQLWLVANPTAELKLQAIRIGDFGITAIPNEVFAITGLKLKAYSPLSTTMNIELANGAEGYIPTPEQHVLGGYNTWACSTAGLEVQAEPKITEAVVQLLEEVSGKPRREPVDPQGGYVKAVLASKPAAYWRMSAIEGQMERDITGKNHAGQYEPGVALYLPGPQAKAFSADTINRAAHFAGGRVRSDLALPQGEHSVELWFWNGLPHDARPVTGYLYSLGKDGTQGAPGEHLGIGGTHNGSQLQGRLFVYNGDALRAVEAGRTTIPPKTWNHTVIVRQGERLRVYLNGDPKPEIDTVMPSSGGSEDSILIGGRSDNFANFEGKIDEVALFDRALTGEEVSAHFAAAGFEVERAVSLIPHKPPMSPQDSIKSMRLEPGMKIELVAAEPLVVDPVAIAWDEKGGMYVAEDRGYPVGPQKGAVALLEDIDGDGRYDKRSEFAPGLTFPNGVMCWKGGVLVTCSPDIFYLKDTDGDGVADVREVVLTGFSTKQSTQLRTSHPTLALDGWVYVTSGLTGGKVSAPGNPALAPVESGGDFRFKLDPRVESVAASVRAIEPAGGRGQFGQSFDDFGRRFVCSNRNPAQHIVLTPAQIARNPFLPTDGVQEVAAPGEAAKVYQLTPDETAASFHPTLINTPHAGTFTSACSVLVFRGTALGEDHYNNLFICEPAQNLLQRQVMEPDGATFTSHRPYEGRDFLASTDVWFRPVFAAHGPDGALYLCDMYRRFLDHPDYIPKEAHVGIDFRAGDDKGRIYRIVSESAHKSIHGWSRDTARRLFLEGADPSSVPLLKAALKANPASARAAAFATLATMDAVDDDLFLLTSKDADPGVRELSVRWIEGQAAAEGRLARLVELADDPSPRVRFAVAQVLAGTKEAKAIPALAKIASQAFDDRWTRAAVLGGIGADPLGFAQRVIADNSTGDASAPLLYEVGLMLGSAQSAERAAEFLTWVTGPSIAPAVADAAAAGLDQGLRSRGVVLEAWAQPFPAVRERLAMLPERWAAVALDAKSPVEARSRAITLLAGLGFERSSAVLQSLLSASHPADVRLAAVRALGRLNDAKAAEALITRERWAAYTPGLRTTVIAELISKPLFIPALLGAVERGEVPAWAVDPGKRAQLLNHADASIKSRAAALFQGSGLADRQKVFEEYKPVLAMKGEMKSGHEVFLRTCAACHKRGGEGANVGPDLTGVRNQPAETLLLHIIIPEQEIYPAFTQYLVQTKDGRTLTGLIASENEASLTLRYPLGQDETIQRSNVTNVMALDVSLMPRELEKTMTKQEMTDLITFLKGN